MNIWTSVHQHQHSCSVSSKHNKKESITLEIYWKRHLNHRRRSTRRDARLVRLNRDKKLLNLCLNLIRNDFSLSLSTLYILQSPLHHHHHLVVGNITATYMLLCGVYAQAETEWLSFQQRRCWALSVSLTCSCCCRCVLCAEDGEKATKKRRES